MQQQRTRPDLGQGHVNKHCQVKISGYSVELSYCSHPLPLLNLKVICPSESFAYDMELTKHSLAQMDPAVLATFDSVEALYNQLIEILKTQPQDFQVGENGVIKVKITISMKSGVRKKELVFQTETRKMTETQKLKIQFENWSQQKGVKIVELTRRSEDLERQVEGLLRENMELNQTLHLVTKEMRDELQVIKEKLETNEKATEDATIHCRSNMMEVKESMNRMEFAIKVLKAGGKKVILVPDKRTKCLLPSHKQDSFKVEIINFEGDSVTRMTKTGKQKWTQIVFDAPIDGRVSYYEFDIIKTKNKYICAGVCSKECVDELDSKWSTKALTLFLLDRSIICEGKEAKNANPHEKEAKKESGSARIVVVINCINDSAQWFEDGKEIGRANFSADFSTLCKTGQIRPLVICVDQDDEIVLR